jgi:hypothetical protein
MHEFPFFIKKYFSTFASYFFLVVLAFIGSLELYTVQPIFRPVGNIVLAVDLTSSGRRSLNK